MAISGKRKRAVVGEAGTAEESIGTDGYSVPAKREPCQIALIARAQEHRARTALITTEGSFTYEELLGASASAAAYLLAGKEDMQQARVAFLSPSGFDYVAMQWGIWRAGGVAVPLCTLHPQPELEYVVENSEASIVVAHPDFEDRVRTIAQKRRIRFALTTEALKAEPVALPVIEPERRAMMLYTSGTTSKPKGVVTTHRNIQAQVTALVSAWGWRGDDHILHVLPLHHIHGIINVLTCALWVGAVCEMMPKFDAEKVWERIGRGGLTLFMAVPTIYTKLIAAWEAASKERQRFLCEACSKLRLMVSGSAALPVPTLEKWKAISSHTLLERYGMTEIGMALSNPLYGERIPGSVGKPLPGVDIRLVDEGGNPVGEATAGEIEVQGPSVFLEYWNRPEATNEAFRDGWFRTGDIAVLENGHYRILGRNSVDIIKTGGYKVSALEIEAVLCAHPKISECAVVGVEDPEWGERVCASVVPKGEHDLTLDALRHWTKQRLAVYKVPTRLRIVDALPRNTMGKVTKPKVAALFEAK